MEMLIRPVIRKDAITYIKFFALRRTAGLRHPRSLMALVPFHLR